MSAADHSVTAKPSPAFGTAHLHRDMKGRTMRGGFITIFSQGVKFTVQMGATAVLARLLIPADFGLVAMVTSLTGLLGALGDIGLSSATVQRAEVTREQISTLFWVNVLGGVIIALSIAASAPLIARFYHEPRLLPVALLCSVGFVFSGLTAQHYALLVRQMRFGAMALVQLLPILASTILAVVLALEGWRYWALVAMGLTNAAGAACVAWIASGWVPGPPRRGHGVRSMLHFGGNIAGYNVLTYLTRNTDNILIGRFLGPAMLGVYAKAYGLLMLPVEQISAPVSGVVLPALCALQNHPDRYRRYFLKAVEGLAFIGVPIMLFSFADARPLVLTVLGPKWLGAVPVFRLLIPAAVAGTVNYAPMWLFTPLGFADRQRRWAMISTPVIIGGFLVGLRWGVAGVAASFSITFTVCFLMTSLDACGRSPVRFREFLGTLVSPLAASILAAFLLGLSRPFLSASAPIRVLIDGLLFSVLYLSLCFVAPAGRRFLRSVIDRKILARNTE